MCIAPSRGLVRSRILHEIESCHFPKAIDMLGHVVDTSEVHIKTQHSNFLARQLLVYSGVYENKANSRISLKKV